MYCDSETEIYFIFKSFQKFLKPCIVILKPKYFAVFDEMYNREWETNFSS